MSRICSVLKVVGFSLSLFCSSVSLGDAGRVQGRYKITRIETVKAREPFYRVLFSPEGANAKLRPQLKLESYHVHSSLSEGMSLDLIAELSLEETGGAAPTINSALAASQANVYNADQILVYVQRQHGKVPLWILGRNSRRLRLDSTSYLKMHDPQSDFVVF